MGLGVMLVTAAGQTPAKPQNASSELRTPWGAPDLQGIWSSATVTPLERPEEFADKPVLTEAEAAAFSERAVTQRNVDAARQQGSNRDVTSAYNNFWYDRGSDVVGTRRTSLIVDPPDGRVPPLTRDGQQRTSRAIPISGDQDGTVIVDSWLDRGLWERCITRGVPNVMLPGAYNNNYQILQSSDYVVILAEMIHDARIIPLDGRPHLNSNVRQWMGDSRGRWEGTTLVVDTTNFTDKTNYRGSAENLHLVERFTRVDANTLNYEVTIEDPTTFVRPWTIALPATATDGQMYEYACHEGNYGMSNLLSGSRAKERELEAAGKGAIRTEAPK